MKSLFFSRSRIVGGLIACCAACLTLTVSAQTVDIGEFLITEPDHTWEMAGTVSMGDNSLPLTATVVTEVGETFHGVATTKLTLSASATTILQSATVDEMINVSLSDTHLRVHSRVGVITFSGFVLNETDTDTEVYNVPANILPRLITVGETYQYTADLDSGSFDDFVLFESIEWIDTGQGSVEAIKLVVFSESGKPVTLWLARNLGYMQASITTDVDDNEITVEANLTGLDIPFIWESVQGYWADTINHGGGWRQSEWFGYFWVPYIDSRWIYPWGMGWVYCTGDSTDMWMYVSSILSWFWTRESYYPWVYQAVPGKSLRHQTGSLWFWDPTIGEWIDLGPQ